jgi:hypothetical protein
VAAAAAGIAIAGVIAACAFGLISTLRPPQPGSVLGVRILETLDRSRSTRSVVRLGGSRPFVLRCRPYRSGDLVSLDGRSVLFVHGPHLYRLSTLTAKPRVRRALAVLAACPELMATELADRLRRGRRVVERETAGYLLRIGRRPRVEIVVDRRRLRPFEVTFGDGRLRGRATVVVTRTARRPRIVG